MSGEPTANVIRRRVIYSGRVQGVCFRMNTVDLSRGFAVVGHVRNLPDGTVELEAEGPPDQVERFLAAVAEQFTGYIVDASRVDLPLRGDEREFRISY